MPMDRLSYTAGILDGTAWSANKLQYNGHETQTDFSLGWVDYGFRQLDAILCTWHSMDKLAESTPGESPYSYCGNDPVNYGDFMGLDKMINYRGPDHFYSEQKLKI